jgi:hypothetical protein
MKNIFCPLNPFWPEVKRFRGKAISFPKGSTRALFGGQNSTLTNTSELKFKITCVIIVLWGVSNSLKQVGYQLGKTQGENWKNFKKTRGRPETKKGFTAKKP